MNEQLRLSMTLSGGASLGAYQAGAMAAVLVWVLDLLERDPDRVRVEAMGGASAGALVAFFSSYALAEGLDPVQLLHTTWVEKVSLGLLRSRDQRAPLDFDRLREGLWEMLGGGGSGSVFERVAPVHPDPIPLHVSLTGLQGLTYPVRSIRRRREATAVTYSDWGTFQVAPGAGPAPLFEPEGSSPLDFVLASAANPGAFAPRLLDRSADIGAYHARGISGVPDHGRLWYGDGGLIQSEPIGRVLSAARAAGADSAGEDREIRRVNLVLDPRSEGPSGSGRWADPSDPPRWTDGISRALAVLPEQIVYDDLRRTEKQNTRLEWADRLVEALAPHLEDGATEALDEVLASIAEDRRDLPGSGAGSESDSGSSPRRKLRQALVEVAGLAGKEPVTVDVISPLLLAEENDEDVPALLAGEFLGDFGGFLREELRQSDFVLGYESAIAWMRQALPEAGFDDEASGAVLGRVEAQRPGDWREANRGRAGLQKLPWRARLRFGRFALDALRVLGRGLFGGR